MRLLFWCLETVSGPETLERFGLTECLELRLGWGGRDESELRTGAGRFDTDGSTDGELGAKILLLEERGKAPKTAI